MTKQRKGEIALVLLRYKIERESIRLTPDIRRELGNVAETTEIPLEELKEFARILLGELLEEALGK